MNEEKNLYLVGFMGAGKTTIGKILGNKLNYTSVDLDQLLEESCGKSIFNIFEQYGEEEFRKRETEALMNTRDGKRKIVSCGGGTILRKENSAFMKETGTILYLKATTSTLAKRLQGTTNRPLLKECKDVEELERKIRSMMKKRKTLYEQGADLIIDTEGKSPESIAEEIVKRLL